MGNKHSEPDATANTPDVITPLPSNPDATGIANRNNPFAKDEPILPDCNLPQKKEYNPHQNQYSRKFH